MWSKTIVGMIVSWLLNVTLMTNLGFIAPLPRQVFFLIAFIGGFILWASIMTVFYCSTSVKKVLLYTLPVLLVSAGVNFLFVSGIFL
ncbi:MAG: hypothetical protein AAGB12_13915 [Pseudomonadota bacterium]